MFHENLGIGGLAALAYEKCSPYNLFWKKQICWVSLYGLAYCLPGWTFVIKWTASGASSGLSWIFWALLRWVARHGRRFAVAAPGRAGTVSAGVSYWVPCTWLPQDSSLEPGVLWQWLADEKANCLNRDCWLHGSWHVQINFRGKSWRSGNWLS